MGKLEASIWAAQKGATIFAFIGVGERFSFKADHPAIFTKVSSNGWYRTDDRLKFRTSTAVAVYPEGRTK